MIPRRNPQFADEWQSSPGGSHAQIASSAVTEDRQRLHRRVLAAAALTLLFAGLLMALSLVLVGLAIIAVTVVALLGAGTVSLLRRLDVRPALEFVAASTAAASRSARTGGSWLRTGASRLRRWTANVPQRTRGFAPRTFERSVSGMYRVGLLKVHSVDPGRRAEELNQLGARLRREGNAEEAAQQHRAALEIVRDLGDQRAEALTLNNLGLALANSGAEGAAVEYLEQAVDVLRELGDEEHEGQAIANLGLVYRRQGETDEATTLFQEALQKLPPASPAYRQVEKELRRAG